MYLFILLVWSIWTTSMIACKASPTTDGLHSLMKAKGKKYFGTATDKGLLTNSNSAKLIELMKHHFGQITPENSMKWESVNRQKGQYRWGNADYLVEWAQNNSMIIRGHTAVWHSQLPDFVKQIKDRETLINVIEEHTTAVVGRWKGKIYAWDVVNEIFDESGHLRKSVFSQVLGEEFVSIAFKAAKAADPETKLYINDYNLDTPNHKKTRALADKVKEWRAQGIPIDGIGSQGHITQGQGKQAEAALKILCEAAPECALTEIDVRGNTHVEDWVSMLHGALKVENCVGVTVWGVSDKNSWRKAEKPLLFDETYRPKPALTALLESLGEGR